jgi:sirohydrochlorin ferrochelatase
LVVVDHGSREEAANAAFETLVRTSFDDGSWARVEPAHMEIAEPGIGTAIGLCLEVGVEAVVVSPFFLLPGRHWQVDIPRVAGEAVAGTDVSVLVTSPIGLDPAIAGAVNASIDHCLAYVSGVGEPCRACVVAGVPGCRLMPER